MTGAGLDMRQKPDIDDETFLEVAVAARVACLVTGNQIHFSSELRQGVTVLSPGEFLAFYKNRCITV